MTTHPANINRFDLPPEAVTRQTPLLAVLPDNPIFLAHHFNSRRKRWGWLLPSRSKYPTGWLFVLMNGVFMLFCLSYWLIPGRLGVEGFFGPFVLVYLAMMYFYRTRKIEQNPHYQEVFGKLPPDLVREFYLTPFDPATVVAGLIGPRLSRRSLLIQMGWIVLMLLIVFVWGLKKDAILTWSVLPYGLVISIYFIWSSFRFTWLSHVVKLRMNLHGALVPSYFKQKQMKPFKDTNSTLTGGLVVLAMLLGTAFYFFTAIIPGAPTKSQLGFHIIASIFTGIFLIAAYFVSIAEEKKTTAYLEQCSLMAAAALEAAATGSIAEDTQQRVLSYRSANS